MERLLAVLASVWAAIKPFIPQLVAFLAGREWEKGQQAKETVEDVQHAARAASRVELMSASDVLRELEKRGRLRVSDVSDLPPDSVTKR